MTQNNSNRKTWLWGCGITTVLVLIGLCILALSSAAITAMLYEPPPTYTPIIIIQKITATPFPTVVVTILVPASPTPTVSLLIEGDIPIMEGAYDFIITKPGANFNYRVEADLETVIEYYQDHLSILGWEPTSQDDIFGPSIATLFRANPAGDQIQISLSYNAAAEYVAVSIEVTRNSEP